MDSPFPRAEKVLGKYGLNICPEMEGADILHVMPSNPLNSRPTLTIKERKQLADWARAHDCFLIENDECGDLDYFTRPVPPLKALDGDDRVIYVGSFAQSFSSAMRIAYFILPHRLLDFCEQELRSYEGTVSVLSLYVVAQMMETGQYERHVRHIASKLRKRFETMGRELTFLGDDFRIYGNDRDTIMQSPSLPASALLRH